MSLTNMASSGGDPTTPATPASPASDPQKPAENLPTGGDPTIPAVDPQKPAENPPESEPRDFISPRPDNVPEKFWDKEKGEIRTDDVLKSYGELEKELHKAKEKPKAPEAYEINVSEEVVKDLGEYKVTMDDPYVKGFTEYAKENGFSQEQYDSTLNWYIKMELSQAREELISEFAKLGDEKTATARIRTLESFGSQFLDEKERATMSATMKNADQVALFEKLVTLATKNRQLPADSPERIEPNLTQADLDAMMEDERYHDRKHPEYTSWNKKVTGAYERLYGKAKG